MEKIAKKKFENGDHLDKVAAQMLNHMAIKREYTGSGRQKNFGCAHIKKICACLTNFKMFMRYRWNLETELNLIFENLCTPPAEQNVFCNATDK